MAVIVLSEGEARGHQFTVEHVLKVNSGFILPPETTKATARLRTMARYATAGTLEMYGLVSMPRHDHAVKLYGVEKYRRRIVRDDKRPSVAIVKRPDRNPVDVAFDDIRHEISLRREMIVHIVNIHASPMRLWRMTGRVEYAGPHVASGYEFRSSRTVH